ncbi:MAG: molybdate ABC transporter substrate-binding protein [Bradyrhizobium sp.]|nr:molybdate ABC transporter substrate-binding protein [Bradyrhizobium sp.]
MSLDDLPPRTQQRPARDPDGPRADRAPPAVAKITRAEELRLQLADDIVRGALALVERNEAPLGIVYGSDAVASKGVKVVGTFPEASHQKVEYPLAIVDGHRNAAVSAFYDYLKGPEASAIFKRYGFTTR